MKITVLAENRSECGLVCEHGLSLFIEYNGKNYLIDCGSSDVFIKNAETLGIDLSSIAASFLSHGHYDHGDGFLHFFEINSSSDVFARRSAMLDYYVKRGDDYKYIGLDKKLKTSASDRFVFTNGITQAVDGIWLIPHAAEYSDRGAQSNLFIKSSGSYYPDGFDHEHSIVFETVKGLVIISSCSHCGAENVLCEVADQFPMKNIFAFIGGMHLKGPGGTDTLGVDKDNVIALAEAFSDYGVEKIYTGHCTGMPAYEILKVELPDNVNKLSAGTIFEI